MKSLEEQLEKAYTQLELSPKNQGSINAYLSLLKLKDQYTYEHSIRVGLLGIKTAQHYNLDQKAMFCAGALHDVGKILISPKTLKKTKKYNKKEMEEMKKHAEYSHQLLTGVHEFSAEIALRHHRYQPERYPKKLKKSEVKFSENTRSKIELHAKILSIIDFYDAITTRKNQKFKKKKLKPEEIKCIILKTYPCQTQIIEGLYSNKIFK